MTSTDEIIEALRPVEDPELHRSIVDLGMVRNVRIDRKGRVDLTIALTVAGCPLRNEIQNRVNGAVAPLPGVTSVALDFGVMTVGKVQGGYTRYLASASGLQLGVGGLASVGVVPEALKPHYGRRANPGVGFFVTVRPAAHKM